MNMDTSKAHNAKVNADRGDMNLVKLIEKYANEDKAREYLEALRWPEGVKCPRCSSAEIARVRSRGQFDCDSCRYQFSVTSGTVLHDTHLPLWKWFLAVYLMCEARKGVSANQLKRTLGVAYKTAWYLCHRIRSAMGEPDSAPLTGTVEVDETYIGGKRRFRDPENKTMVLGAVQRGGKIKLSVETRRANREVLHSFIKAQVSDDADAIFTDTAGAYRSMGLADENTRHEMVNHKEEEWVRGDVHTNTVEGVWSLFKRSIVGSYHQLSVKHLDAYLDEFEFRFNNRENPFLFRDTLIRLLTAEALPYTELIADAASH